MCTALTGVLSALKYISVFGVFRGLLRKNMVAFISVPNYYTHSSQALAFKFLLQNRCFTGEDAGNRFKPMIDPDGFGRTLPANDWRKEFH
jgi:hypothetical protein